MEENLISWPCDTTDYENIRAMVWTFADGRRMGSDGALFYAFTAEDLDDMAMVFCNDFYATALQEEPYNE